MATYCDIFCEKGYFEYNESKKFLHAAKKLGFKLRIHADEFEDSEGAKLAALVRAHSADHLMAVSEQGIKDLKKKNVVATVLPGATLFLGKLIFAPGRDLTKEGVRVAIGTDYNPGSSVFQSQPLMMNLAMTNGNLTLD